MVVTLLTLLFAAAGFVWGRIRADVVALIALVILALSGVLTVGEALSGFANPIVIMMIGLFVVGGAIFQTGLAKMIGARLLRLGGGGDTRLFLVVVLGTALIGGFVSNTGTVALMLPIVASMAAASGVSASRLLMPLAFASSMGGMMTLIGTPPNLVVAEVWEEAGGAPLSFFTFLPAGLICLAAGTLLLVPLSKWFLDRKGAKEASTAPKGKSPAELAEEYGIKADLVTLHIPAGSPIAGKTLAELQVRRDFGVDVIEVRRDAEPGRLLRRLRHHAADPTAPLHPGETMIARGPAEGIDRFARLYGLTVAHGEAGELQFYEIGVAEIVPLPDSSILGHTVAELDFRGRWSVNVLAIRRKGRYITTGLGECAVHGSDVLLVQGPWKAIGELSAESHRWVVLGQPLTQAAQVTLDYKAPVAALIMAAMVVALVFDFVPAVIAVIVAALLTVLTGCFRNVDAAYRTINWESVVLIGAMMPMSFALEKTGISAAVADSLVRWLGNAGPLALLAGIYLATSVMTMFISNTATAVLMAPIAMSSALALGVSGLPFLFAVSFGASLCFASPFSTPPNALVMPAGQYRFSDYIKVGLPLQVLLGVLMIIVLPLLFPW